MNRQGKALDAIEERMQSANKASWRDILVYRSKDVPWRITSAEDWWTMCIPFSFLGSEIWSWTIQTMDRIKRWETKKMVRLFRFRRGKDETGVEYHRSCCKAARKIWIQMALPFLYEMIAESMWRGVGWVCDKRPNAVIDSLKQVSRWRGSRWWHAIHTKGLKDDPQSHMRWRHK